MPSPHSPHPGNPVPLTQPPKTEHPKNRSDATESIANNDVDSYSIDTKTTMQTSQYLQMLPAELIGMLSEELDDEDLLAMRSTCRELRDGSAFEFCQRYLDFVEISGSRDSVRQLIAILTSLNLPHAQQTVKKRVVSADLLRSSKEYENPADLEVIMSSPISTADQQIVKQKSYEEPDAADVARLLRAMPNMTTIKLVGDMNVLEPLRGAETAPIFFACMAQLASQVRRLDLFAVELDGDVLAAMLEAHRSALLIVNFNEVTLDSRSGWQRVLETLRSGRVRRLDLAWLRFLEPQAGKVDLSMPKGRSRAFRTKGGGVADLWGCFAEAVRTSVKPALKFILQGLENEV